MMEQCGVTWYVGIAIALWVVYKLLDRLLRWPRVRGRLSDRYIVVTGCDTGFGNEIARRLDSLGCHVFAGCLTEKGEVELRKACSERLTTLSLDVASSDSVRRAFDAVSDKLPPGQGLWALLNNAGVASSVGPEEMLQLNDYRPVLNVNLLGVIDMTLTFLPLVKRSRGRVVNMASILGRYSLLGNSPYCVSKFGVEAFTDGLRRSVRCYGCKAILIEPGFYRTHMTSKQNLLTSFEANWKRMSPQLKAEMGEEYHQNAARAMAKFDDLSSTRTYEVLDAYEHALLGMFPRPRYVVGWDAHLLWLPLQALPEWLSDWMVALVAPRPMPAADAK